MQYAVGGDDALDRKLRQLAAGVADQQGMTADHIDLFAGAALEQGFDGFDHRSAGADHVVNDDGRFPFDLAHHRLHRDLLAAPADLLNIGDGQLEQA